MRICTSEAVYHVAELKLCVCVCVCEKEREREGKTERQKERGAEKEFTVKRVKSGSRPGCVRGDKGIPAGLSLGGASLNDNIPPCTQLIQ